jgi:hypothetical protein
MNGDRNPIRLLHLCLLVLLAAAACAAPESARFTGDIREELAAARGFTAALAERGRAAGPIEVEEAVALGYLERLRLGLGSPFRLVDQALVDPRLRPELARRVGWALLAGAVDRAGGVVEPAALDWIQRGDGGPAPGLGRRHLEVVRRAVLEGSDARGGEVAVRLAYALAAGEGTVRPGAPALVARVAATLVDAQLAREDAIRLLRAAGTTGRDPLELVPEWRAERRFQVERPRFDAPPPRQEREALEMVPALLQALRSADVAYGLGGAGAAVTTPAPAPLLGAGAAAVLRDAAAELELPPHSAVVVALMVQRDVLLDEAGLTPRERAGRAAFVEASRNEESLVAEHALLVAADPRRRTPVAATVLWAATALRAFAQEEPWFPGMGGPTPQELQARFRLGSVRFDDEVPEAWRPYYRRLLAGALADVERVLPSVSFRGLNVRFGGRQEGTTLALHDPRSRTLVLPVATGAGTVAHEIAHDLDWQLALRRYNVRGAYATDRAAGRAGDRLGELLLGLGREPLEPPRSGAAPMHARRPAEVFARAIDWFVAVSLAREGRSNGALTSVLDDVLTGFGSTRPPDVTGGAGLALVAILDEVAPVFPETRSWFLGQYGTGRVLTPYDLVRRVLEAPFSAHDQQLLQVDAPPEGEPPPEEHPPLALEARFARIEQARSSANAAIDAWVCRTPMATYDPALERARRRLVLLVAEAQARGVVRSYVAEAVPGTIRPWPIMPLGPGPRHDLPADSADAAFLDMLVRRAEAVGRADLPGARRGFDLPRQPGHCAAAPLFVPD